MKSLIFLFSVWAGLQPALAQRQPDPSQTISLIGLGSCAHQNKRQPLLDVVVAKTPDVFVYLGDNIYGDTPSMRLLKRKYTRLAAKPEFERLVAKVPILATWDDHDYGKNDAGKEWALKERSREIFLDFWKVPANSARRQHPGIYDAQIYGPAGKRVQIILLDTRTFRDPLLPNPPGADDWKNNYRPNEEKGSTFLGAAQWTWLAGELKKPAELRIIATSNQFSHTYNGWESWTNVPREREKMIETIRDAGANGVVFISGDVHWGELSKLEVGGMYPLYDLTSSGITETWPKTEPNDHRIGDVVPENNVGFIRIDWSLADPTVEFTLRNVKGVDRVKHTVSLSDLSIK